MDRLFSKRSPIVFGSFVRRHVAIEEAYTLQPLHVGVCDVVFFMRGSYRTHEQDMCVT